MLSISKSFLHVALFSVVVVITGTFFPFIGGKYYFFRLAVEAALFFFVLWWAFKASPAETSEVRERIRWLLRSPLFIAVSAFVLVFLLASLFAHDPRGAFWSNYERGEGGFQMLHYYAFFVLLAVLFKKQKDWQMAFHLSLGAAFLLILYGIASQLGWGGDSVNFIGPYRGNAPTSTWNRLVGARFQGSLGNPAYVAPYLMFALFYALYLWQGSRFKNRFIGAGFYGVLSLFFIFFFVLTQTRGAFLGLVAALVVFFLYLIFIWKEKRKLLLGIFLGVFALGTLAYVFRHTPFIQALPGSRILDIGFGEQTVRTRLYTWNSAWQGFKERPFLGWGPENFSTVFDRHFDPRHFVPGQNSETWFDRAHSVFFDYLAETGLLGLLAYLSILVVFFVEYAKRFMIRRDHGGLTPIQQGLLVAVPVGYFVQGLALFDVLPIYLNLFLFLAFTLYLFAPRHEYSN